MKLVPLVLGMFFLALPAAAATCYPPVDARPDCPVPEHLDSYRYQPGAFTSVQQAYQNCLVAQADYDSRLKAYNTCADDALKVNARQACEAKSDSTITYTWTESSQTCRSKCVPGYYLTESGGCKMQSSLTRPVPVEQPVAVPVPAAPAPQKTILDAVPVSNLKKEISPAKPTAIATATTPVPAVVVPAAPIVPEVPARTWWQSVVAKLFSWF